MINKSIKTKWLNALRSNKYSKNNGPMKAGKSYNPLGILCEVTGNSKNRRMTNIFPRANKQGEIEEFMGLSPKVQQKIVHLNTEQSDFNEVIRYISRNIKVKN